WFTRAHGLDQRQRRSLVQGRQADHIERRVHASQVGFPTGENRRQLELRRVRLEFVPALAVTNQYEADIWPTAVEFRGGLQKQIMALDRHQASDDADQRRVGRYIPFSSHARPIRALFYELSELQA